MARQSKSKKTRRRYSEEFKTEALALAQQVGVSEAASRLELQASQLYGWRSKAQSKAQLNQADHALAAENAKLKRLLADAMLDLAGRA